jgi:hypothetical protein
METEMKAAERQKKKRWPFNTQLARTISILRKNGENTAADEAAHDIPDKKG